MVRAVQRVWCATVVSTPEVDSTEFRALGAPASLAAALAARGYERPTPVQAMVLGAPDRDLLVSAQTGSGKTVAFGLLLGRVLLGDDGARVPPALRPRALVIAPTRELAAQVQRELAWLFGETGARVLAFTGGTDLRRDARALERGVEIVVGTPGRLVDLMQRGSLDLGGVQALVLDEADEMLDMGFREALESLLGAAAPERRTLLFSATLPPPIRALAQRYQRDSLQLDPRTAAGGRGEAAPHEDIRHVVHLCANGERLAALVNVLLVHDDERAVVFCRTRENVADLHRQLGLRGFSAESISGERAQEERTRALEALRDGRVRVLVATDVAARGLDLPDLGLVIHADLPESAESLTHRSGRTGRAGRKGVNILLVEKGAMRRAERLMREAGLRVEWTQAPSADAVAAHGRERLVEEIAALVEGPVTDEARALATRLLSAHAAEELVAGLVGRLLATRPRGERLTPVATSAGHSPSLRGQARAGTRGEMVLFQVNLGENDGAEPNWILPLVCRRGAITRRDIGAIRVARDRTVFEVSATVAGEFAANASERDPRAPHVRIELASGELPDRTPPRHPMRRPSARPRPAAATHGARTTHPHPKRAGGRPPTKRR